MLTKTLAFRCFWQATVGLVTALLCLAPSPARAEGEHWVPLYNKLARMLNERSLAAGETVTPNQGETQVEAEQRYVKTNGTLSPATEVTQSHLQTLRSRVISLATNSFIIRAATYNGTDPIRKQFEYVIVNNQHTQDQYGVDVLVSPSIFQNAGLPNHNAFTSVPAAYGSAQTPYSNSFTDMPVLWEHFQELYATILQLEWTSKTGAWVDGPDGGWDIYPFTLGHSTWAAVVSEITNGWEDSFQATGGGCWPWAVYYGYYQDPVGASAFYDATAERISAHYKITGLATSLSHTVDFYVTSAVLMETSATRIVDWADNGDSVVQNQRHKWSDAAASTDNEVTSPAALGSTADPLPVPTTCQDPITGRTLNGDGDYFESCRGWKATSACAIVKWTFTAWKNIAPTDIRLTNFRPPKDPDTDALVASCVSCGDGACGLEYHLHPSACGMLPGLRIFLGISDSLYGPPLHAYISQGNTALPHTGLALGPTDDPLIDAGVRDTGIVQSFSLDTRIVADTGDFVSVLRPTGRIVTFSRTTGKPLGPDKGNSYRLQVISEDEVETYYEIVFGELTRDPESIVIHRYRIDDRSLCGVARGPSFDTGETCSGTPGDWPGLTWNTDAPLASVVTPRFDVLLTGDPVSFALFRTPVTLDSLARVTFTRGSPYLRTVTKELFLDNAWVLIDSFFFTPTFDVDTGQITKWTVIRRGGTDSTDEESVDPGEGTRTVREKVILGENEAAVRSVRVYGTLPWGEEILSEMQYDPDDPAPAGLAPTTYEYYTDLLNDGASYGHLKQVANGDGSWTQYAYQDGRVVTETTGFLDTTPDDENEPTNVTTYSYAPLANSGDDGSRAPNVPRTTVVSIGGQEVSRSYVVVLDHETRTIRCTVPSAAWNATSNLVTVTTRYASGGWEGHTSQITNPDGTVIMFNYADVQDGVMTTTWSGHLHVDQQLNESVDDGRKSVTVVDPAGRTLLNETYDVDSELLLSSTENSAFDGFGRPTRTDYMDGTFTTTVYACCGPDTVTDRDGMQTQYIYDDLRRVEYEIRNGITTHYTYDADGNVISTVRTGTDDSEITLSTAEYDGSGRQVSTTDALDNTTFFAEALNPDAEEEITVVMPDETEITVTTPGYRNKATLYADASYRIEKYNRDGSLLAVGGTAAHPVKYEYGADANGRWTKEIRVGAAGAETEWVKTYTDMLGRQYKTVWPGNPNNAVRHAYFNAVGQMVRQVDPDGVTTLYEYNGRGEQAGTVIDIDQDGEVDDDGINNNGTDRVVRTQTSVLEAHNATVRRTTTTVHTTDGNGNTVTAAVNDTSADGLQNWSTSFGLTTHSVTVVNRTAHTRTVTTTAPDGSYTVSVTENGRPASVTRYDAADNVVGEEEYSYDAHGRRSAATDARNGTTTYAFNNGDQVVSVTTPDPDGAGSQQPQVTGYEYDSRGRQVQVTLPDSTAVHMEYWPTGELKKTYGSRTYPVEYTYDSQGRMAALKTWQNYTGNSGTATTTWSYDAARGFLTAKGYPGAQGPSYTYTAAGRVYQRTSGRGGVTTYGYGAAGDLVSIGYTGSAPSASYTYDRMGRRATVVDGAGTRTLSYTASGELAGETWTGGLLDTVAVTWSYDNLHRRSSVAAARGQTSLGSTGYTYDDASRLSTVTSGAHTATYTYQANSILVNTLTFNNGSANALTTTRTNDALNRLVSISNAAAATVSYAYLYNTANQRIKATLADGSYWVYQYDTLGQVTSGQKYWSDDIAVTGMQFGYSFDDIGNRKTATANGRQSDYSVNSLNQYDSATVPGAFDVLGTANADATVTINNQPVTRRGTYFSKTFTVSNPWQEYPVWAEVHVVGVRSNVGPNGEDAVTEETGHRFVGGCSGLMFYDADGNLSNDTRYCYTWDDENRLTSVQPQWFLMSAAPGAQRSVYYAYDHQGRRIRKTVYAWNTSSYNWDLVADRLFVYDGWNLIAELNANDGSLVRKYAWGVDLSGSLQGAGGVGGLLAVSSGSATSYTAYDGNGNVAALIDAATGAEAARYEYDPFGNTLMQTGTAAGANPFRFSTKYTDAETGFLYYGLRYYSPNQGRWINRDSIAEKGGTALYGFVRNAPVSSLDVLGQWGRDVHLIGTRIWAMAIGYPPIAAEAIAAADNEVDGVLSGTGFLPSWIYGDQSYHFDRPWGGPDSRLVHRDEHYQNALHSCSDSLHQDNPTNAAMELGISLHPAQDYYAHGDYGRTATGANITVGHNSNAPGSTRLAGRSGALEDYPDDTALDALNSVTGRPDQSEGALGGEGKNYLGSNYEWYVYEFGRKRVTATVLATQGELSNYRTYLRARAKNCCMCLRYFGVTP